MMDRLNSFSGIRVSHRNIEVNTRDIIKGIRLTSEDVSVSWMPLYHDMGLVGFHFTPLRTGVNQHFIEPVDFIKNPFLWLDIISGKHVTITACPNFGQSIVSRSLKRKKGHAWDLSSVRVMFNGAEPISVATMNEFTSLMKDHGFRPGAMFPAYGMAEATLAITFPPLDAVPEVVTFDREQLFRKGRAVVAETGDTSGVKLVNLGTPLDHCDLRITSASRNPLPEDCAGRVMVSGENITPGYFNDPATTRDAKHQGWLNTGDLGFMHNGCLFILGRVKDIIFVNGMNYYSHDLENVAERLEGIPAQKIVIAGYFDENSRRDRILLFLVAPDDEGTLETFRLLKTHFLNSIGLLIDTFIPVRSADIPRTSSGKIQRYKMVERFLRGEFEDAVKQI